MRPFSSCKGSWQSAKHLLWELQRILSIRSSSLRNLEACKRAAQEAVECLSVRLASAAAAALESQQAAADLEVAHATKMSAVQEEIAVLKPQVGSHRITMDAAESKAVQLQAQVQEEAGCPQRRQPRGSKKHKVPRRQTANEQCPCNPGIPSSKKAESALPKRPRVLPAPTDTSAAHHLVRPSRHTGVVSRVPAGLLAALDEDTEAAVQALLQQLKVQLWRRREAGSAFLPDLQPQVCLKEEVPQLVRIGRFCSSTQFWCIGLMPRLSTIECDIQLH